MDETLQREKHQETACGAGNLNSLSRFPSGESRGGRVPPTPHKARLPPQEGCRPPVNPPHRLESDEHLGTFYFALTERKVHARVVCPTLFLTTIWSTWPGLSKPRG